MRDSNEAGFLGHKRRNSTATPEAMAPLFLANLPDCDVVAIGAIVSFRREEKCGVTIDFRESRRCYRTSNLLPLPHSLTKMVTLAAETRFRRLCVDWE